MTRLKPFAACLLLPLLSACLGGGAGDMVVREGRAPKDLAAFNRVLGEEYANLAAFELAYHQDAARADWFMARARRAQAGQPPAPENPLDDPQISDAMREALGEARINLMQAQELFNTPENAALLAMAQTRYDCWLVSQRYNPPPGKTACQAMFEEAMQVLSVPGLDPDRVFTVLFRDGLAEIDAESRAEIQEVARLFPQTGQYVVVMKTHTGSRGNKAAQDVLSMRRSIAVRNSLAQLGIDMDYIKMESFGKNTNGKVDIQILSADEASLRKAAHLEVMYPNHF